MADDPLCGRFDEKVDALLIGPTPVYEYSATLRVADLYGSTGELRRAAENVGMDVVYAHEPDYPRERVDFEQVPDFDFLTATLPEIDERREDALLFALRFLRVRRPTAFVFVGGRGIDAEAGYLRVFRRRAEQLGYRVTSMASGSGFTFILGTPPWTSSPLLSDHAAGAEDADLLVRAVLEWVARTTQG